MLDGSKWDEVDGVKIDLGKATTVMAQIIATIMKQKRLQ